jgi:hypothetical protein
MFRRLAVNPPSLVNAFPIGSKEGARGGFKTVAKAFLLHNFERPSLSSELKPKRLEEASRVPT